MICIWHIQGTWIPVNFHALFVELSIRVGKSMPPTNVT